MIGMDKQLSRTREMIAKARSAEMHSNLFPSRYLAAAMQQVNALLKPTKSLNVFYV